MIKLIALDFGHGGKDSGAVGNGLKEKDIVLEIGLQVKQRLLDHGFKVTCLRENDSYVGDAGERGAALGKTQADYALSIHLNSETKGTATGAEIIVPCKESYAYVESYMKEELEKLGKFRKIYSRKYNDGSTVERQMDSRRKFTSTVNATDYYGICREAWKKGVSATIVELFFISNASDCENYKKQKSAYVEAMVKAICKGFNVDYLGLELVQETVKPTTSTSNPSLKWLDGEWKIKVLVDTNLWLDMDYKQVGGRVTKGEELYVTKMSECGGFFLVDGKYLANSHKLNCVTNTWLKPLGKVQLKQDCNLWSYANYEVVVGQVKAWEVYEYIAYKNGMYQIPYKGWVSEAFINKKLSLTDAQVTV